MYTAYHAVTERPMQVGQIIEFDETHHSGVWQRVMEKRELVEDILAHPEKYPEPFDHHTDVAIRELAMEQVRRERFPHYPSRLSCLYVSLDPEMAITWAKWFREWGRSTFGVVELSIEGRIFSGNANLCFDGTADQAENRRLADRYWRVDNSEETERPVPETLADGRITVVRFIREAIEC